MTTSQEDFRKVSFEKSLQKLQKKLLKKFQNEFLEEPMQKF